MAGKDNAVRDKRNMESLSEQQSLFLSLIRLGVGHSSSVNLKGIDWMEIETCAHRHGLLAVVIDALDATGGSSLPLELKLEWIGEMLQNYEQRYVQYEKAVSSLAGFYNKHGYKMMVLKGYACSLDWPKPKHRPCGDIDIWQFGHWKDADAAFSEGKNVIIDKSHHHHTVFEWNGFVVENHYDFINVHHHKSHVEFEKVFKELGQDDSRSIEVNGEKVYLPSLNLHALFLVKHMMQHFATSEITLRQLLDWGFFVEKHGKEVDWILLEQIIRHFDMKELYNVFNAICVGDLGFDMKIFPNVQFDPSLKDKVLADILSPKYTMAEPREFFKRVMYKYKRWQGNAWKHDLCYKDSRWSSFWSGVWNHLLKPSSI